MSSKFFRKTRVAAIGMALAIAPMVVKAQDKISLSLDEAIEYALEHNREMENADLAVKEAEQKIWETTAQGLPQIDAAVDYSNFMGAEMSISFMEGQPPMTRKFEPTSNAQLTVGQLIFSGSYLVGLQSAKLYRDLTELQNKKTALDIKAAVINSYYLALMAQRSKEIVGKNLENLRDIYRKTESMVYAGVLDKYDLDQLSVQMAQVEQALKSAERQEEISYNMLRLQLGVNRNIALELTDSLDGIFEDRSDDSWDGSLAENLDLQLMHSQGKMVEKQVELEKMAYLPTVTAFYSHTEKILKPEFDLSPKNVIGLQANIPIFSSGMRRARVNQAKIRLETQRNSMSLLEEQLAIQEKQLIYNLTNAREQYEIQKRNIEVSKAVYENFNRKYEHGMASSLDLTTANNNYLQAESGYINAMLQLLDAETALMKLYNRL